MRCDDNVTGCAPCLQNQSECNTTDRITGKATVRGYVQSLERRLEELENHNRLLQGRLVSLGEEIPDVKPNLESNLKYEDPATAPLVQWHEEQRHGNLAARDKHGGSYFGGNTINKPSSAEESLKRLPEFRSGLAGTRHFDERSRDGDRSCRLHVARP